jgi:hypothetical protein
MAGVVHILVGSDNVFMSILNSFGDDIDVLTLLHHHCLSLFHDIVHLHNCAFKLFE